MADPLPEPPRSRRDDVIDVLHGRPVADPYRWLEDSTSAETVEWVENQRAYARKVLDGLPGRAAIEARLEQLFSIGDISTPAVRGRRYFFERRDGNQDQPILWMREGRDRLARALLDPNLLDPSGLTALDWWYPSPDGRLLAYGLSSHGDERSTLHVLSVDREENLPDRIANTRAASLAWRPDSTGFYYTRYPDAATVPAGEEVYHRRVYFHHLGKDPDGDELIFGAGRDLEDWPSVQLSRDGRYLFVIVNKGWDRSDCYLREEGTMPGAFVGLIEGEPVLSSGELVGGTLLLLTNLEAANNRLLAIDPTSLERSSWREVVPERPDAVLTDVHVAGSRLMLSYLMDASSRLETLNLDGSDRSEIELPGLGTLDGLSGEWDGDEGFFRFSSHTVPPAVYRYDVAGREVGVWESVAALDESADFEVSQVRYPSKDGTLVPMFIVAKRGVSLDGHNPTVLSGYGGFNISMTPSFSRSLWFWLQRGGIYAVPNLRGGGEYGEAWHQGGMLASKQNVFDDFIAAAEFLCHTGYTSVERLAISGGSNGGLLVGAALTQRPDLFRAAVCAVPLLDMLRYHRFQIARLWVAEYGSAEDSEQFAWLWSYSPFHHVHDGTPYPAVLLLTGESDTRVDPLHARKMTARLQAASSSGLPVLLRVESDAGHGAGRPLAKTLNEQIDVWSFLSSELGVPVT